MSMSRTAKHGRFVVDDGRRAPSHRSVHHRAPDHALSSMPRNRATSVDGTTIGVALVQDDLACSALQHSAVTAHDIWMLHTICWRVSDMTPDRRRSTCLAACLSRSGTGHVSEHQAHHGYGDQLAHRLRALAPRRWARYCPIFPYRCAFAPVRAAAPGLSS